MLQQYLEADRSLDNRADDWSSAFHIIVLCAEILTCCYGDEPKAVNAWSQLAQRVQAWMDTKAISFEPLLSESTANKTSNDSQTRVFPEIWLLNDCHGSFLFSYKQSYVRLTFV